MRSRFALRRTHLNWHVVLLSNAGATAEKAACLKRSRGRKLVGRFRGMERQWESGTKVLTRRKRLRHFRAQPNATRRVVLTLSPRQLSVAKVDSAGAALEQPS